MLSFIYTYITVLLGSWGRLEKKQSQLSHLNYSTEMRNLRIFVSDNISRGTKN